MELRIDEVIREKGYKKSYVAQRLGKPKETLSRWISGKHKISLEDAVKLAEVLEVNIEELYVHPSE